MLSSFAWGDVSLLRRQAALGDREVGAVAGGIHVGEAAHAAVVVDRDEPWASAGSPGMAGPDSEGSATTASAWSGRLPGRSSKVSGFGLAHGRVGDDLDPAAREQLRHRGAGGRAKQGQRSLLGSDDRQRTSARRLCRARRSAIRVSS
jgi:hypothetical protein